MEVIQIRYHLICQWHHPILLVLVGISLHPQYHTMEIVTIDPQMHLYLMRDINCNHLHLRCLQIFLVPHQNLNKGHTIGAITVSLILRGIGTIVMIKLITDMIEGIMVMVMIENNISMIEDILMMIEDITMMTELITLMIEDITLMTEGVTLMRGEEFLLFHQVNLF
jgi:hypothetical protein